MKFPKYLAVQLIVLSSFSIAPFLLLQGSNGGNDVESRQLRRTEEHNDKIEVSPVPLRTKCINEIREVHNEKLGSMIRQFNLEHTPQHDGHWNLLVQPAFQQNLGDTLLTLGEQTFYERQDFSYQMCLHRRGWAERNISHCPEHFAQARGHNLAFWHAGGNWGDLWDYPMGLRLNGIKPLLQNNFTLVTMPQSLFYQSEAKKKQHAIKIKQSVTDALGLRALTPNNMDLPHSRLVFTWRERDSYEIAKELYPFARNLVVPDIAFQLGEFQPTRPRKDLLVDIVLFLRDDKESTVSHLRNRAAVSEIISKVAGNGRSVSFRIVDWNDRQRMFGGDHFNVTTAYELLALGKVVIVDRLHAAILSYLSGLHFIYIDNMYAKLTKTLTTAIEGREECALWERSSGLEDALQRAINFLDKQTDGNIGEIA